MNMENKEYGDGESKMEMREKDLLSLMDYPPFSEMSGDGPEPDFPDISERGEELRKAISAVHDKIVKERNRLKKEGKTMYDIDPQMLTTAFDEVYKKFDSDIEEAEMFRKRYPKTPIASLYSVWKPKQQK